MQLDSSLNELSHTGSSWRENFQGQGTGMVRFIPKKMPVMALLGLSFLLGTGATTQVNYYYGLDEKETIITESQLKQMGLLSESTAHPNKIISAHEQLSQLQNIMGLNILEIAAILQVSRPTVYSWLESENLSIRKNHQVRLNSIYEFCKLWEQENVGKLGSYLHKPIDVENHSLFSLLKSKMLNHVKITSYIEQIAQVIRIKRKESDTHVAVLRKHGFEPVSKEDMEDRLNDINFMD